MKKQIRQIIKNALKEDAVNNDITSSALIPYRNKIKAVITAKQAGIFAGGNILADVFKIVDKTVKVKLLVKEGNKLRKGQKVAEISGDAKSILKAERVALNFAGRLSGIATLTNKFVLKVPKKVKIMDTRKTTPGLRELERYAVKAGGGDNHRFNLSDQVLIKENHLFFYCHSRESGNPEKRTTLIKNAIMTVKKKIPKNIKIEVEVETFSEFKAALQAKADIIMLDNMNVGQIKKAVALNKKSKHKTQIEISGNVTLSNIKKYASLGVDRISIGALTHSVTCLDLSLRVS